MYFVILELRWFLKQPRDVKRVVAQTSDLRASVTTNVEIKALQGFTLLGLNRGSLPGVEDTKPDINTRRRVLTQISANSSANFSELSTSGRAA